MSSSHTFDAVNNLTEILNLGPGAVVVSDLKYRYDKVGNRIGQTEVGGTVTSWTFDKTYQLTRERRTGTEGFDIRYKYDAAGNRIQKNDGTTVTTYTFSDANRLELAKAGSVLTTYVHDAAGNRLQEDAAGISTYFTWNAAGQMVQAEPPAGVVTLRMKRGRSQYRSA